MNIVTDSTGKIVMMSNGRPAPPDGCALHELNEEQSAALQAVLDQPNGGVTFDGESFTALPVPTPPKPRAMCSPWQFRKQLRVMGIKAEVESLIAQQDEEIREAFEYATEYWSDNPVLLGLAVQLSSPLTEDQVYDLVKSASTRVVGVP